MQDVLSNRHHKWAAPPQESKLPILRSWPHSQAFGLEGYERMGLHFLIGKIPITIIQTKPTQDDTHTSST